MKRVGSVGFVDLKKQAYTLGICQGVEMALHGGLKNKWLDNFQSNK